MVSFNLNNEVSETRVLGKLDSLVTKERLFQPLILPQAEFNVPGLNNIYNIMKEIQQELRLEVELIDRKSAELTRYNRDQSLEVTRLISSSALFLNQLTMSEEIQTLLRLFRELAEINSERWREHIQL